MEYSPPPLFKQGASARVKVVFFAMIAIALLVVDARLNTLAVVRQGVGIMLYPLQMAALVPRDAAYAVGDYFTSLSRLNKENADLKRERVAQAQALQQGQYLMAENAQLRALLAAAERLPVKSVMSEILYDTRDAFTRKIVVDRGAHHGVAAGQPVIDDIGVVGQITRVFPFTSEVTLLTDKDFAIPVQVVRSGVRSIAYGLGQLGVLDLRFVPANTDIQKGDVLVTTGIDGVYPPGLLVAGITQVESKPTEAFARIMCQPSAGIGRNKQLLILMPEAKLAPRPEPEDVNKKDKPAKKTLPEGAKEPAKTDIAPEVNGQPLVPPAKNAAGKAMSVTAPAQAAPKQPGPAQAIPAQASPPRTPPAQSRPAVAAPVQAAARPAAPTAPAQAAPKPPVPAQTPPKPAAPVIQQAPKPTTSAQTPPRPAAPARSAPVQVKPAISPQPAPPQQVVPQQAVPQQATPPAAPRPAASNQYVPVL
jgi:rod shape-determining protein MreC